MKGWIILTLLASALLAVNGAQAGKGGGGKPGGGVDFKTTAEENYPYWDSPYIWEKTQLLGPYEKYDPINDPPVARFCGVGGPSGKNPQGGYGYVCHQLGIPMPNTVHIDLSAFEGQWTALGRGAEPLCQRLDTEVLVFNEWDGDEEFSPSFGYWYAMDPTWIDGPCIDENDQNTCWVKASTSAYFWEGIGCNEDESKCGRLIRLEGWGYVEPFGIDANNKYEANAFRRCQDIPIKQLVVKFHGINRTKTEARCIYNFGDDPEVGPEVGDDVPYFKTRTVPGYDPGFCGE